MSFRGRQVRARRRERPALQSIHIEPAVAIEVDQADPAAGDFRHLMDGRFPIVEDVDQTGPGGIILEPDVIGRSFRYRREVGAGHA